MNITRAQWGVLLEDTPLGTFKVFPNGDYDVLAEIDLALFEPSESLLEKSPRKIAQYVALYREGSPFPPISCCGTTPQHPYYRITNGHHRYLAAQECGCVSIPAWSCVYMTYMRDCDGEPFPTVARISETTVGHRLAQYLGWHWCSHCGSSLNVHHSQTPQPAPVICVSCQIAKSQGHWKPSAFEQYYQETFA
jgi:hypothetical protein